ncbi:unnamed protein product [Darwinula stevensoni]|uniref:Eukaryotic translation initiation factor 3 subunit G n=1 Tax=Darwinula stevensoni TaxID=69355 RepID=A0A7R9FMX2_9CRUS|nr:unnamed protein product [Darwinula stevensoni]CAG0896177.1 unnamed protein product [Darwinula stevensoni]
MPSVMDQEVKSSWADEVEEGDGGILPPPSETVENGIKTVVEYSINEDGKRVKIVRQYKIENRRVLKSVARRKNLQKFGQARGDKPGPNPANTINAEEVFMQFITAKDLEENQDDDPLAKLKNKKGLVKCRYCDQDHWTTQCPYKDSLAPIKSALEEQKPAPALEGGDKGQAKPGKYISPALRGERKPGESMSRKDDLPTIRVTNLSESTRETDLQELFRPFGQVQRIYLAKDKNTGAAKGFGFVTFQRKEDAALAIQSLDGFGYDHLILSLEWAKTAATERTDGDSRDSYDRFGERVKTYEPALWKGKPISPFSAALHGWRLVDKDLLGCVTCDRVVSAHLPCPSRVQLHQSCSRWLKEKLRDKGHEKECPWRGSPCPQDFLNVPILSKNDRELVSALSSRCSHLAALPTLEHLTVLGAGEGLSEVMEAVEALDTSEKKAATLALFGWEARESTVTCDLCSRVVDPMLLPGSGDSHDFHAMNQHQYWCPWIRGPSPLDQEAVEEEHCGWKEAVSRVLAWKNGRKRKRPSVSASWQETREDLKRLHHSLSPC